MLCPCTEGKVHTFIYLLTELILPTIQGFKFVYVTSLTLKYQSSLWVLILPFYKIVSLLHNLVITMLVQNNLVTTLSPP